MAVDHIRYDILAQEALRGVVRTVLEDVAKGGLPGDHHFYITFDTQAEGVQLSQRMRVQYPKEMTIVLQHQFWDLTVTPQGFEVGLSFGGVPERLAVPFAAIKGFFDPSVEFGLKFEEIRVEAAEDVPGQGAPTSAKPAALPARPAAEHKQRPQRATSPAGPVPAAANPSKPDAEDDDDGPDKPAGSGEVVRLDRFRKK